MARRIHVDRVEVGATQLQADQAHHVRNVLRLAEGAAVEVFDSAGQSARATLHFSSGQTFVRVTEVEAMPEHSLRLTVASAVPKRERADWLVEKLSELGVDRWIPLAAARSVSLPEGKGKRDRWERLAIESAKQARRAGVMDIGDLTPLPHLLSNLPPETALWCLTTERPGASAASAIPAADGKPLLAFVGPEGGWTSDEIGLFEQANACFVRLTQTILRIETAAVAVAAIVQTHRALGLDVPAQGDDHAPQASESSSV